MVDLIPEKGGSDKAFVELLARVSVFCILEGRGAVHVRHPARALW